MIELRQELFHPAVSHFPVVLIFLTFAAYCAYGFCKLRAPKWSENFKFFTLTSLYLSIPSYFLALFLGEMSLDIVKNDLCQIASAYQHEQMAETGLYLLILTVIIEILTRLEPVKKHKASKALPVIFGIMLFINTLNVARTSHSGGELVYEQGAAVKNAVCD